MLRSECPASRYEGLQPVKKRKRTVSPAVSQELEDARLMAARAYQERTREAFAQALREASSLGALGRGVLAGPMVKNRSLKGRGSCDD